MPAGMSAKELYDYLENEYNRPFTGWNFSYLDGRHATIRTQPLWDYTATVVAATQQSQTVLDIDTGGGELYAEFLAQVGKPLEAYATEGYPPNVVLSRQKLEPLGVRVYEVRDYDHLPFADEQFDLVINRHGAYVPTEIKRILAPDGLFITQQVGDQTNLRLRELLGYQRPPLPHPWNLAYAVEELQEAGWRILEHKEEMYSTRYYDSGAIAYYLKGIPWEIPDFSVQKYFPKLVELDALIQQEGYVDIGFHQFFIIAQKF